MATREIAGYAYGRLDNPTVVAFAAAVAELEGAETGYRLRLGHGRDPCRARDVPVGRRPGRRHGGLVRHDPGPAQRRLRPARGDDGLRRRDRSRRGRGGPRRRPDPRSSTPRRSRTRRSSSPTIVALAELAHRYGALYLVDNTFASPYLCRPLELGADLVIELATKFIAGHSDVMAGIVAGPAQPRPSRPRLPGRHRREPRPPRRVPRDARPLDARAPDGAPLGDRRGPCGLARGSSPE